jgi:gamma-glutamylcyclotransferase (GGCT)/AIG2-like uncharacterized protein YtfP
MARQASMTIPKARFGHLPIFVYQGELRGNLWPRTPQRIVANATTTGSLWDLGGYPALTRGEHSVVGELVFLHAIHMSETIAALDQIEGYHKPGDSGNLYFRDIVECRYLDVDDETSCRAYTYFFAHPNELIRKLEPDNEGKGTFPGHITLGLSKFFNATKKESKQFLSLALHRKALSCLMV